MAAQLQRQHFDIPRASEYFSVKELQAQTGQPEHQFFHVLLKELVDNAIDAAEAAGIAPEITVNIDVYEADCLLAVVDNGPGIPAEVVERILNFETRTSDKAAYRAPTRGAQGNALKTVIGIPYAMSGERTELIIIACNRRHDIGAYIDAAGEVKISHHATPVEHTVGTRLSVYLPLFSNGTPQTFMPVDYIRGYALSNPHASVKISVFDKRHAENKQAHSDDSQNADFYHSALNQDFRKFLPTDLTAPAWYSQKDFERLL